MAGTCKQCGIIKTLDNCYRNPKGYWYSYCRKCKRELAVSNWDKYSRAYNKIEMKIDMTLFNKLMRIRHDY